MFVSLIFSQWKISLLEEKGVQSVCQIEEKVGDNKKYFLTGVHTLKSCTNNYSQTFVQ